MTYHAEVLGSLLRPTYLLEARQQFESGQLAPPDFKAIEDRAVNEAVALQEAVGLDVITDGEMRRHNFYGHLIEAFDGFDMFGGRTMAFRDEKGDKTIHHSPVVTERLKWRRNMCAEEWVYLRARKSRPAKMTMPNVMMAAAYYDPERSQSAYPTQDAYLADLVDFSRREVEELIRLGCTYIQFDAPNYTGFLDPRRREGYRRQGIDPDKLLARSLEVDNAVIDGHPGVTFAIHLCRGNNQSKFFASGDYEPISQLFSKSHFQRFLLEYDDERSGGFEVLQHVPDDRVVALGLITTKKPELESPEELRQRIQEATRYMPLERLALSPQCGFASTIEGNDLSFEDQRRKLELVVNVAREVWGS
jgi:5-methyltetrahydropteroyltriglutamate--homocysteine methyltransferase